ncbi:MAG TPA: hypothetical protein VFN35_24445 [Ktedonobacteraceae bacterium]|nr:hypothetical protein [Ktedonobacteraceae bacterium]
MITDLKGYIARFLSTGFSTSMTILVGGGGKGQGAMVVDQCLYEE